MDAEKTFSQILYFRSGPGNPSLQLLCGLFKRSLDTCIILVEIMFRMGDISESLVSIAPNIIPVDLEI